MRMYHTVARHPTLVAEVTPLQIAGSVILIGPSEASAGDPDGSKIGQSTMIKTMNLRTNFRAKVVLENDARARNRSKKMNASRINR
jgi:hypothetical protein